MRFLVFIPKTCTLFIIKRISAILVKQDSCHASIFILTGGGV